MKIDDGDPFSNRPYTNLQPILDALIEAGNVALNGGFVLDRDGWRCRLANPIDFERVDRSFELPRSVRVSRAHDAILDESTWVSIEGPGAHRGIE